MKAELRNLKELRPGSLQHILPSAPHGGRVAPQPGVSETEARASGDPSPDGNSVTSRHPFREKGPIRQGFDDLMCSSLPMCVALFLGWVGALAALHALDCDWALDDPGACALGVLLGFVIFELLTVRVSSIIYLRRFAHARPGAERVVSLVLLHGAAIWYGVARLSLPDAEADGVGTEVLRLLLLYASLIGVWALGRSETDNARVQNLLDQIRELRTANDAMQQLLAIQEEDDDDSVDTQGDEREYLIVPPPRTVLPADAAGQPGITIPMCLEGHPGGAPGAFDRALALKIASRLRHPKYSLAHYYEDLRAAFPELRLYMATFALGPNMDDGASERLLEEPPKPAEGGDAPAAGGVVSSAGAKLVPSATGIAKLVRSATGISSGIGADEEYRRSIGALFAVYWLMRIGIDGERGFSFGVDDRWEAHELHEEPAPPPDASVPSLKASSASASTPAMRRSSGEYAADRGTCPYTEPTKRRDFYEKQDWARLQQLLIDAGLLARVGASGEGGDGGAGQSGKRSRRTPYEKPQRGEAPSPQKGGDKGAVASFREDTEEDDLVVVPERVMAMLALTAFHDVMKVEALLPAVAAEHAPYCGFKAGDVINDHDVALGYVLDHHPSLLPSFGAAREEDQRTIRFTQSKMGFNHGWLVQGEAPPAPLFAKFKEVVATEHVDRSDVAFYFVHWLTDLAGAEPSPLGGAEKFVLKFPHAVLDSFIRSFGVLNQLADNDETAVMEAYLVSTWIERPGAPPELPKGDDAAIAKMRLSLQAQTPEKQEAILRAFSQLSDSEQRLLSDEMARTGIENQRFKRGPAFSAGVLGPTFLVYYSPAFVRNLTPVSTVAVLRALCEVYRRARQLWPLRPTAGSGHSVTIRIDQLKELKLADIMKVFADGESWLLVRKNDQEGVVERHKLDDMAKVVQDGRNAVVLKLWRLDRDPVREGSKHSSGGTNSSGCGSHRKKKTRAPGSGNSGSQRRGRSRSKVEFAVVGPQSSVTGEAGSQCGSTSSKASKDDSKEGYTESEDSIEELQAASPQEARPPTLASTSSGHVSPGQM